MAATEISEDVLEDHVKQAIEQWKTGGLFMSIGVKETDKILNPGDIVPEKTDKNHPFIKFLDYIALDISRTFVLERSEKKSILRRLQSKSEKWRGLIAPTSKETKSSRPEQKQIEKETNNTPMTDLSAQYSSHDREGQSERGEPSLPADAKEFPNTSLEEDRRKFEEARDLILADVPESVKDRFGEICFAKWGREVLPVLVLSPYSVPPGGVRDKWLAMYFKTKRRNRLQFMTHLTYWYGASQDPANAYSFLSSKNLTSYEVGLNKNFHKVPAKVQQKVKEGKPISSTMRQLVEGLKEMAEDLKKHPKDRNGYLEKWIEPYAVAAGVEENVTKRKGPPPTKKTTKEKNTKNAQEKRTGEAVAGVAKRAKIHPEEELSAEVAPDETSSSTTSPSPNDQNSRIASKRSILAPLEEADEPELELIPRLLIRDLWSEKSREVEEALDQLADLCLPEGRTKEEATTNAKQILESAGHIAVLKIMQRFPNIVDIQEGSCRAIGNASSCHVGPFSKACGAIGTVEAVLKAMKKFPRSRSLQQCVAGTINNLLFSCAENVERFVKAKGIEVVVAAMKIFSADSRIQESGCRIFLLCTNHLDNRDDLIELDALTMVSKALKDHRGHDGVKTFARRALAALAKED